MGWSSYDDFLTETQVNGKKFELNFSRTLVTSATSAAGRWHECLSSGGTGGPMTLTGTAGTGIVMSASTNGRLPINADVSPDTKHLVAAQICSAAATVAPGWALLTDIIHIYPSLVVVTTPSTLSNHPTWTGTGDTRMTNAVGVQASFLMTTASSAAGQITHTYTNSGGTSGRTTTAPQGSVFGPVAATPGGCFLNHTTVTATTGGLMMPLAAGDVGVQSVQSYAINTGATGGTGCIILHRPIAWIPIVAANTVGLANFMSDYPSAPRIYDNACLGLFARIGGAATTGVTIEGHLVLGHG